MGRIRVSMALARYVHCADLVSGEVQVEGAELVVLQPPIEETLQRFAAHRHLDVSEYSLAQYVALRSRGDDRLTALPIFPSRVLRHSSIYVTDGGLHTAADLLGRRVGVPEWAQTAGVWIRGALADSGDLDLSGVTWVQAGVNTPGRVEATNARPPAGWSLERRGDSSLDQLLLNGEIDAVMSARPPASFADPLAPTRRLYDDHRAVERTYWRTTGILPPMHVMVMRTELYDRHPWLAASLLKAFEEAKQRAVERLTDPTLSFVPLPWVAESIEDLRGPATASWWPYGVEDNRETIETFVRHAHAQGIAERELSVDGLFAPVLLGPGVHV